MKNKYLAATLIASAAIVACGGGGGGDSANPEATTGSLAEVPAAYSSELTKALNTGAASGLTDQKEVLQYAVASLEQKIARFQRNVVNVIGNTTPSYDPTANSIHFVSTDNQATSQGILVGDNGLHLAAISSAHGGRALVFGTTVYANYENGLFQELLPVFKQSLTWLIQGDGTLALPPKIKITFAGFSDSEIKDNINVLKKLGVAAESVNCKDDLTKACTNGAQLVFLSGRFKESAIPNLSAQVEGLMNAKVPVMYQNRDYIVDEIDKKILEPMNLRADANIYSKDKIANGKSTSEILSSLPKIEKRWHLMTTRILNGSFPATSQYDWSQCETRESCEKVPGLAEEVINPMRDIRNAIGEYNAIGQNIFFQPGTEYLRAMVLWADMERKKRTFPIDNRGDTQLHRRSLLADHLVPLVRTEAITNPDLGEMSGPNVQKAPVTTEETIEVRVNGFHDQSTQIGRYAIPGKTFTVEAINVPPHIKSASLFFYTHHVAATKIWPYKNDLEKYKMPSYGSTSNFPIPLKVGRPMTLTSPYGGPMQLKYEGAKAGDVITLRIKGVAQNPFLDLTGSTPPDIETFSKKTQEGLYDWIVLKLPALELTVHRRNWEKGVNGKNSPYNGDVSMLINELQTFLIEDIEKLAGFSAPNRSLNANVDRLCKVWGIDCTNPVMHARTSAGSKMQGNIGPRARAGNGTAAGTTYDIESGVSAREWGDAHEIGHTLQTGAFDFYSGATGETSNNIFPEYVQWKIYSQNLSKTFGNRDYVDSFRILKDSNMQPDWKSTVDKSVWFATEDSGYPKHNQRLNFYIQWVHYFTELWAVPGAPAVENEERGWGIYTLLYLHLRNFRAIKDEDQAAWEKNKGALGYSTYDKKPVLNTYGDPIPVHDHMLLMLSRMSGKDQSAAFKLWGITVSDKAKAQLAFDNLPKEDMFFYSRYENESYSSAVKTVLKEGQASDWTIPISTNKRPTAQ